MLTDYATKQLQVLLENNIAGAVLKKDLKEWLLKIQDQNAEVFKRCTSEELMKIAKGLGIVVVDTKEQYNKIKSKYNCKYEVPELSIKKAGRKPKEREINKEMLEDMIFTQLLTQKEMAAILHMAPNDVAKWIKHYGLTEDRQYVTIALTKELLYELYVRQKVSVYSMAKALSCNRNTIDRYIEKYNLRRCC